MEDLIIEIFEMQNPVLIDDHGKQLDKFDSASIQHRKSGNRQLNTKPQFLRDDLPTEYSGLAAPALYLTDGKRTHKVIVNDGVLQLA